MLDPIGNFKSLTFSAIRVQDSDMIITLSAAVSQLYKSIDVKDKLIAGIIMV